MVIICDMLGIKQNKYMSLMKLCDITICRDANILITLKIYRKVENKLELNGFEMIWVAL